MNKRESARRARGRVCPEGELPLVNCEGTARECGLMLGSAWKEALTLEASRARSDKAWWKDKRLCKLISEYAPHLPDLYRGMARGAGLREDMISWRAPQHERGACTSFAVAPGSSLDRTPISGQTKDVSHVRGLQLVVLRVKMTGAPSMLTLTYQGWLFGHGFVKGGTAVFRNSLYVETCDDGLPYDIWGILALHCRTVEDVIELTRRHGMQGAAHVTVADERGGIVGIENGRGGPALLKPKRGIYVHANCVVSGRRMMRYERGHDIFHREDSLHRTARLRARLEADRGRLTAQLAHGALCDHDGYPLSVCRHESVEAMTSAAVVVEPTRGLLHATRGAPCQNWPRTYRL